MISLIDQDIIKYAVGFACQRTLDCTEQTRYLIKRGTQGMEAHLFDEDQVMFFPELKKKAEVQEELQCIRQEINVDPIENALHSVKKMMQGILAASGADEYIGYLTKGECFRHHMSPLYKANRKDTPKPLLCPEIEKYLIQKYDAVVCEGIEADDAMGIQQCQDPSDTIICTIDKDLDTIPGWHYNWDKQSVYNVTPEEATKFFWMQVLMGDTADNIIGLKGIGPMKASRLLEDVPLAECRDFCLDTYLTNERSLEDFDLNCKLLWILRKPLEETYCGLNWV